jgi:poly-gamma-glutamate synthesis protein (capsule biosynthesis protein)
VATVGVGVERVLQVTGEKVAQEALVLKDSLDPAVQRRKDLFAGSVFIPATKESTTPKDERMISLVFVGDIMLDRGVAGSIRRRASGDYQFAFANVPTLKNADVLFGNLEGPLSDKGSDRFNLYSFRFAPESITALTGAGFDVLSVANNHIGDWGRSAFVDTLSRLESVGIVPVGDVRDEAGETALKTVTVKGQTIGFLGFTDVGPNWLGAGEFPRINIASPEYVKKLVTQSAPRVDYLIVSFHFGNEYQTVPSARQRLLAQTAIDAGAKLVVGHHPHVIELVEEYHDGLIAYSLGNFVFDQNFSEETMQGRVLEVLVKDGQTVTHFEHLVKHNRDFQPTLVPTPLVK